MTLKEKILIGFIALLTFGCDNNECFQDYRIFSSSEAPLIRVIGMKPNCVYRFEGQFWFEKTPIISEGDMVMRNDALHLKIDLLDSSEVTYFDFSKGIGDHYDITFDLTALNFSPNEKFVISVDNIVKNSKGAEVFVFRVNQGYIANDSSGYRADLVYFVTRESGIIGSFISKKYDDVEAVMQHRGDILEDVLDYSTKEFRDLH